MTTRGEHYLELRRFTGIRPADYLALERTAHSEQVIHPLAGEGVAEAKRLAKAHPSP